MNHYVYYSYENWGRGYIGCRSCDCLPEEDVLYFGSYHDKTFKPTEKIILETFSTREEAIEAEVILHDFYQVHVNPHFANRAKQTTTKFTTYGIKLTEEQRRKISARLKGKKLFEERIQKVANSNRGKKRTEESRKRMSESRKNSSYVPSEEVRKKMGESKRGPKNHNYGKPLSDKTKRKLRESQLGEKSHSYGKPLSEETRKKISEKLKGREMKPEWIEKAKQNRRSFIGEGNPFYGKRHTEETRELLRKNNKGKGNPNYGKSPSAETRKKLSESKTGRKLWNNGEEQKFSRECPGDGWILGGLKRVNNLGE